MTRRLFLAAGAMFGLARKQPEYELVFHMLDGRVVRLKGRYLG
jgi:hypothetical protein